MLREEGWWREGDGEGKGNEKEKGDSEGKGHGEKGDGEGKGLPGPSSLFVDGPGPSLLSLRVCPSHVIIGLCRLVIIACVIVMSSLGRVASSLSSCVWSSQSPVFNSWCCNYFWLYIWWWFPWDSGRISAEFQWNSTDSHGNHSGILTISIGIPQKKVGISMELETKMAEAPANCFPLKFHGILWNSDFPLRIHRNSWRRVKTSSCSTTLIPSLQLYHPHSTWTNTLSQALSPRSKGWCYSSYLWSKCRQSCGGDSHGWY